MANNYMTHLLRNFQSKNMSQLVRRIDGMVIGLRKINEVAWGEDPRTQQHRVFIDEDYATKWLFKIADADQNMIKGTVCKACGKVPGESIVCADNEDGAHRLEYSATARIEEQDAERRITQVH